MHSDRFPHGIQYGNRYAPPPITAGYVAPVPGSEYPPAAAADYAPPPYVKDADGGGHYAPVRIVPVLIPVHNYNYVALPGTAPRPAAPADRRGAFANCVFAGGSTLHVRRCPCADIFA
jgi:hypothetical protein